MILIKLENIVSGILLADLKVTPILENISARQQSWKIS